MGQSNEEETEIELVPKHLERLPDPHEGAIALDLRIDVHPCQPWVLFTPDARTLHIWNYENRKLVALWRIPEVHDAREAKFIVQKDWIVVRHRGGFLVCEFQASSLVQDMATTDGTPMGENQAPDLTLITVQESLVVNRLVVHPNLPYLLTGGGGVVLWNWDQNWERTTFRGHILAVTDVAFHPSDQIILASASYDGTIKVWNTESNSVVRTLRAADMERAYKIQFCTGLQKKLLVSTTNCLQPYAWVWNYETGDCVAKLEGSGILFAFFHPHFPYIFTAAKGGEVRVWRESNYQLVSCHCPRSSTARGPVVGINPCKDSNMLILALRRQFQVVEVRTRARPREKDEQRREGGSRSAEDVCTGIPFVASEEQRQAASTKKMEGLENLAVNVKIEYETETEEEMVPTVELQCEKSSDDFRTEKPVDDLRAAEYLKIESVRAKTATQHPEKQVQNAHADKVAMVKELEKSDLAIQNLQVVLHNEIVVRRRSEELRARLSKRVWELEGEKERLVDECKKLKLRILESEEQRSLKQLGKSSEVRQFSLNELQDATDNFDPEWRCGEGDQSGTIYRGKLCDGTPVLVKKVRAAGAMPEMDCGKFKTEVVDRLRMLHHPHLLTLLGVCYGNNCMLVYRHEANGSVKDWIAGGGVHRQGGYMPWYVRFRVMVEVARALCFLHSNPLAPGAPIIHRAIKPANILLDKNFVVKIGDLEHALLAPHCAEGPQTTGNSISAFLDCNSQYMAPECFRCKIFNEKTDIFAFGITILEMLTGKFWAALEIMEDAVKDDAAFRNTLDRNAGCWNVQLAREVAEMGLSCASLDRHNRPNMMDTDVGILPVLEAVAQKAELRELADNAHLT
ncbi:hypothetical protein CBR_g8108 [Chara braunii]|uniref:Protein kinase domain-containing protein n=1 Tax=Chara braunii TaxID=69332 RepID=A0A388KLD8_CHABU|nr:hypothetical protein CBR_g8108 [Chara braunii]|eukprot:GBG70808.1 hypothetical protein CBR_g8108 [Chara braunii]